MTYLLNAFDSTNPVADTSALRQEFNGNTYRISGMGLGNIAQPAAQISANLTNSLALKS